MNRNLQAAWDLPQVADMLNPAPLMLEMGVTRTGDGRLVAAARADLPGCKGEMIDWWFRFFETTEHLKWWHPADHKKHDGWDSQWQRRKNYIGATINAVEALGDIPATAARIKFHHPADFFGAEPYQQAQAQGWVSAAVCGCIGFGDEVALDDDANPLDGRMIHVVRDTAWGCVLRSRFILGESSSDAEQPLPDAIGLGLMQHCHCEFTSLSKFLPSLFYAENVESITPPEWW